MPSSKKQIEVMCYTLGTNSEAALNQLHVIRFNNTADAAFATSLLVPFFLAKNWDPDMLTELIFSVINNYCNNFNVK
ncbi:MAG: hypothetical protein D3916_08145 [Candidatus Electrothrix sp. MAN1_4]|nr:hypothetical protein [Candidatus Electrothrix sp. MAN1_4]